MPDAADTSHSRTGTEFANPAAPQMRGTLNGDHRCRLMTAGTGAPTGTAPTLKAKFCIHDSAWRTSGSVVGLSRHVMRNRPLLVAMSAPPPRARLPLGCRRPCQCHCPRSRPGPRISSPQNSGPLVDRRKLVPTSRSWTDCGVASADSRTHTTCVTVAHRVLSVLAQ